MQQYFHKLIIVCAFLVTVSGCKKDDKTPLKTTGYVQYKLEGTERRYDDYDQVTSDITLTTTPNSFAVNFTSSVTTITNQSLYFQLKSGQPLETKTYTLNSKNKTDVVSFVETETDLSNYAYYTTAPKGAQYPSSGVIELTRVDTALGGRIEGKFSFTNLYQRDRSNIILNYYKNLTEGTFSLPVK